MRIALLTAGNLVPDAPNRRADAWLFDVEFGMLAKAFAAEGMTLEARRWSDEGLGPGLAGALALTAWDYQDGAEAFLATLDRLQASGVPVFNPPELVRWNIRKTYLRELAEKGVATIPTLWPEKPVRADVEAAFDAFGCERVVLKRQVGAGARAQQSFRRGEAIADGELLDRPGMIQPFIRAIAEEGELSFLFIDGEFSHALVKRAAAGDYRIQAAYGGVSETLHAREEDRQQARAVLDALHAPPLYARIDMVRGEDGKLLLMELEAIEPYLFPEQGPQIASMLAKALRKRL